jgi:hypothetical protein
MSQRQGLVSIFVLRLRASSLRLHAPVASTVKPAVKTVAANATRNVRQAMSASAISAFLLTAKSTRIAPMA